MRFLEYLQKLANDELEPSFTSQLIERPNIDDNPYLGIGDRWCAVEELVQRGTLESDLLTEFAFKGKDPDFSFSAGNLVAQYIPFCDFIDNGCALVIFSLVGSKWTHVEYINDQVEQFNSGLGSSARET